MNFLISFCLNNRITVILLTLALAVISIFVVKNIPVDVFPELKVPRVTIQTEAPGLTAEEVEQYITIPIESAMNGTAGVKGVRSSSGSHGLAGQPGCSRTQTPPLLAFQSRVSTMLEKSVAVWMRASPVVYSSSRWAVQRNSVNSSSPQSRVISKGRRNTRHENVDMKGSSVERRQGNP